MGTEDVPVDGNSSRASQANHLQLYPKVNHFMLCSLRIQDVDRLIYVTASFLASQGLQFSGELLGNLFILYSEFLPPFLKGKRI